MDDRPYLARKTRRALALCAVLVIGGAIAGAASAGAIVHAYSKPHAPKGTPA